MLNWTEDVLSSATLFYYRLAMYILWETMKLKSWLIAIVAALLLETEYSKGKMFISECEVIVMSIYILY